MEYSFNCWSSGGCRESLDNIETLVVYINQTTSQINDTVNKVWDQFRQTDESVVLEEETTSSVVNSTSNLTIEYSIDVPAKEGYQFLPIRIFYWFLNESNTTCYNQAKEEGDAESPFCNPLVAHTIGETQKILNFTVDLRPSLPVGNYTIVRRIEIDPENVWINYGHEAIGSISVLEDSTGSEVGALLKTMNDPAEQRRLANVADVGQTNSEKKVNPDATGMAIGQMFNSSNLVLIISGIMLAAVTVYLLFMRKKN